MNEIFVARKAFAASLIHLRAGDVGADEWDAERRVQVDDGVTGPVPVIADHHAVGSRKSGSADPSFRNSGQEDVREAALALLGEDPPDRGARADGTVDFITSAWRSESGIEATTAFTADKSASPE